MGSIEQLRKGTDVNLAQLEADITGGVLEAH